MRARASSFPLPRCLSSRSGPPMANAWRRRRSRSSSVSSQSWPLVMVPSYLAEGRSVHTEVSYCSLCDRREHDWGEPMIRLTEDEAWAEIAAAHTGILTTLRRDGMPIALPVWFVAEDRTVAMRTPGATKKIARIRQRSASLVSGRIGGTLGRPACRPPHRARGNRLRRAGDTPHRGGHRYQVRRLSPAVRGLARGRRVSSATPTRSICALWPRARS